MSAASSRTATVTSSTAPICTSPTAAAPTAANCSSSTPVPLREAPTSSAFAAAKAPARDEVFVFTGSGAMGSGPAAPAVAPASTPVSSAATPTVTPVAPPLASAVGPVLAPSVTSAVTPPEAKRARTDVVDVPLDKAVRLVGACGGRLVHRTGLDGVGSPYSWPWSWTVQGDARPGDERSPLRFEPLAAGGDEYETIRAAFDDTCRGRGFRVTGICRVENDRLLRLFQNRVRGLEERCGEVAVVRVYHGTLRASVEPICEGNLDPQLAGRASAHTRWGKGVNFSPISYYSSHYCDQQATHRSMLVCDVAMSRVCSARDIGEAPPLPEDAGRVYDTNVKLEPSVQVVCKFADNEFYPAYVIDYAAPPAGHRPEARRRKGRMGRGVVGAPSAYYHQVQPQRVWPWQRGNGDFDDVGGQRQPGYDFTRYSGCNFNFTTSSSFTQYAGYNGFSGYTSYTGFRGYSGYYPSQGAGYHNYRW
ncbi:hypothetical protein ONE63_001325 [Megalurothrips usitatus]|uniref:PARP catalytic domain-containing protein n=1 Tax=Megalurothrips usitatus TaxID=439358 RepID=A0AAV7XBR7_9NEOP|nr:hypothetical protein ONE63_001325 [Megalurothrips usitatus]